MELVFVALPVALVIGGAALAAFIWAARDDQFEDLDTPPTRALFEDLPAGGDAGLGSKGDATPRTGASATANERGSA
ncbi:MAG: cbb3-type cytochrome oxidase assembly protein CcoS [Planctomycetota bacterium]|jgi:cbb3-type cytochrome oxidase maturation protein|nr:cbb3-type cytochrome oxidase assembly protein CcoS [Planctomycetota bacterium]